MVSVKCLCQYHNVPAAARISCGIVNQWICASDFQVARIAARFPRVAIRLATLLLFDRWVAVLRRN
ncbi:hypothetical protein SAMN06269301_0333 [Geobacter sp. DSM 9736]|nr:hypothetical protein SAMN06269301_0333 [Geobacter sp. DSM 9736]